MKLRIPTLILAAAATLTASAQDLRTSYFMETSTYRHEMNPALLDQPYVTMPLLFGNLNVGTTGNASAANFFYKMQPSWQGYGNGGRELTTFMHPNVDRNDFLDGLKERNNFGVYLKYQILGVAFKAFGGVNSVDLSLRSNTNICLPKDLFGFMKETGAQEEYDISTIGVNSQSYMELGLGHARRINDRLRVGAKVKLLFGLGYGYFKATDFHVKMNEDQWIVNGKAELSLSPFGSQFKYKKDKNYVDPETGQVTDRQRVDGLTDDFKANLAGMGMAVDLGATYKLLPDLTLSAALTDFGFISWNNALHATSQGEWTFDGFKNDIYVDGNTDTGHNKIEDQLEDIGDDLEDLFALYDDGQKTRAQMLAATLNVGAEYTLPAYRKLRFGFLYTSRIEGRYSWHQGMLSANVRPIKAIEVSANVAASSTGFTWGAVVDFRAPHFNFFVGTDHFRGKRSKQGIPLHNLNSNISLGMSFPL